MTPYFIKALEAGHELQNPAMWKKRAELVSIVGAVIAGVVTLLRMLFPDLLIPDGWSKWAAEGVGTLLFLLNLYSNRATTKKDISAASLTAPAGGN